MVARSRVAPDERTPYPDPHDGVYAIMTDFVQIIGAVLVLAGFASAQLGWVGARSIPYLTVNAVGAALLAVLALHGREWGFLLLEGVWTLVSLISLAGVLRRGVRTSRLSPMMLATARGSPPRQRPVLDAEHRDQQQDE